MSAPIPLEQRLLAPVTEQLQAATDGDHLARLDVLEAVASLIGGFSLERYRATDGEARRLASSTALALAEPVDCALGTVPIHPSLALSALARAPMARMAQRTAGAYYTDFRLARFLASRLIFDHRPGESIIDPASGTGVLLAAGAIENCGDQEELDRFVGESVHAADLSPEALRGVKLSLASLTGDDAAIAALAPRLRCIDSLATGPTAWHDLAPDGFCTVIGNPPWETLKITRHEHLAANGVQRHYGADYDDFEVAALTKARAHLSAYVTELSSLYERGGGGENDLYKLFLALSCRLAAEGGQIAMLVPAGLIRSQGTEALRRLLLEHSPEVRLTVLDNKPRFFGIDTRFKFLAVRASVRRAGLARKALVVEHGTADQRAVGVTGSACLARKGLRRLRPDLSVPEVRSIAEWRLFEKMAEAGSRLEELSDQWPLDIVREVDMTNDRQLFSRDKLLSDLPLIEGRMVHQFRAAHKAYVSGTGRSAVWHVMEIGDSELVPQFRISPDSLSQAVLERADVGRIGFCDITGQTNERTMLAARIPAGSVCGNKVPTITFSSHPSPGDTGGLFLAVANSFAFDWLLRRLTTTTINYFVLRGMHFPTVTPDSRDGRRLIKLARLVEIGYRDAGAAGGPRQLAEWRAEIDALVFRAYGLDLAEVRLALKDFPLLDRGQLPLPGERRSTVTRDLVIDTYSRRAGGPSDSESEERLAAALLLGAVGYVPAEAAKAQSRVSL